MKDVKELIQEKSTKLYENLLAEAEVMYKDMLNTQGVSYFLQAIKLNELEQQQWFDKERSFMEIADSEPAYDYIYKLHYDLHVNIILTTLLKRLESQEAFSAHRNIGAPSKKRNAIEIFIDNYFK